MTGTDIDLDDEPALTAEGEVAAAICSHQVVMQRGDALTADMFDEFHGFVQEELAALLEEKIAYLSPSPTASSPTPLQSHRRHQLRPDRSQP